LCESAVGLHKVLQLENFNATQQMHSRKLNCW